jgi:hypothetical protein
MNNNILKKVTIYKNGYKYMNINCFLCISLSANSLSLVLTNNYKVKETSKFLYMVELVSLY